MEEKGLNQNPTKPVEKKPNLLYAVLAAIGLSLIGCVLYGVLYYVGYIAWIVSYITILAAGWGYKHFNKKMDWKGYLTVAIVSIAGLIISMFISLTLVVAKEFGSSFGVALKDLFTFLDTNTKLRNYVVRDGVLTAVFTLLGLLSYYFYEKRLEKTAQKPEAKTTAPKQEEPKEVATAPAKVEEKPKTTETAKSESVAVVAAKKPATPKKVEETKPAPVAAAPAEKKVTAVPAELKEKPAKKPAPKKPQSTSTNKPLVIKPVVSSKPKTTTTKKTDKKGE